MQSVLWSLFDFPMSCGFSPPAVFKVRLTESLILRFLTLLLGLRVLTVYKLIYSFFNREIPINVSVWIMPYLLPVYVYMTFNNKIKLKDLRSQTQKWPF